MPHQLSRRQVLAGGLGGLAALGAATLAGCAPQVAGAAGAVPLKFWHLLSGGDGVRMSGMLDEVNAGGDVAVRQTVLAWGTPYYTKLAMASVGGRAPDIAIMHASRMPGYAPGGLLDPWDLDELAEAGVDETTFSAPVWEKGFSGDRLFSVALDAHPFVLFFNQDIADRAGVLDSDGHLPPVDSPEGFIDLAREVGGVSEGRPLSFGYLGDGAQMWRLFSTFYRQQGATMELPEGGRLEWEEDAAVTSLAYMQELLDDEIAANRNDYASANAEFQTGQSGMIFSGVWELPAMLDIGLPVGGSPIPTLYGTPAAYADSHAFVLPHQNSPDPERRAATYRFVAELLGASGAWAEAGHIPAFLPVTESPGYGQLKPQADYAAAADIVHYDPTAWFTGAGSNFQGDFGEAVQGALLGGGDPASAVRAFQTRVDQLLSRPNPVDPEGGSR
ncbi:extracellular solute-binding protein [Homoserinibacter sp. YIM 151385]|uniref:extracellular solute-binding protein n=1 Tax=Homoserinibacter sp. YIM 151385 TaxID=2985506 RepID=UPI0022EFEA28|nr:extracellular solute-binding protein [Homoserinibacter sp. YIM 151385]WBU37963.1 extracellular solute-binding protein [Homoserinibacter sp. YIM 151385]